jgi:hypothetical protein
MSLIEPYREFYRAAVLCCVYGTGRGGGGVRVLGAVLSSASLHLGAVLSSASASHCGHCNSLHLHLPPYPVRRVLSWLPIGGLLEGADFWLQTAAISLKKEGGPIFNNIFFDFTKRPFRAVK